MKKHYSLFVPAIRTCSVCKEKLVLTDFNKDKTCSGGRSHVCKYCYRKRKKIWRNNNLEWYKAKSNRFKKERPHYCWAANTINNHRNNKVVIDFTPKELEAIARNSTTCPYCGKTLNWEPGRKTSYDSPSLDNVNCQECIGLEDIEIICFECNTTKGSRTREDFLKYCRHISNLVI